MVLRGFHRFPFEIENRSAVGSIVNAVGNVGAPTVYTTHITFIFNGSGGEQGVPCAVAGFRPVSHHDKQVERLIMSASAPSREAEVVAHNKLDVPATVADNRGSCRAL